MKKIVKEKKREQVVLTLNLRVSKEMEKNLKKFKKLFNMDSIEEAAVYLIVYAMLMKKKYIKE